MTDNHVFQIAIVGEDLAAVTRAQKLSRRLAAELEPELEISNNAWQFEALDELPVLKEAAKGAAKADMIIIATNSASELPARVKSWIESWQPRKRKRITALVALCDHEVAAPDESSPLCAYLRRIAGEWGMDFLTNSADGWQHNFEFMPETPHHQRESQPETVETVFSNQLVAD